MLHDGITCTQTNKQIDRQTGKQTNKHTDKQTNEQTSRDTHIQRRRHTHTHTHTCMHACLRHCLLASKIDSSTAARIAPMHGTMEALRHLLTVETFVSASGVQQARGAGCGRTGDRSGLGHEPGKAKGAAKGGTAKRASDSSSEVAPGAAGDGGAGLQQLELKHRLWSSVMIVVWQRLQSVVACTMPTVSASAPEGSVRQQNAPCVG